VTGPAGERGSHPARTVTRERSRAALPRLRVACTTLPGVSHLFPMLPLLRGLAARGHDVVVASSPSFQPIIEACGFRAAPLGADFRVGDEGRLVPALAAARARHDRTFPYTRIVLVEALASQALPATMELFRNWKPDLLVRDPVEFAGFVAAETLGIPHVTGRENRFLTTDAWRQELGESLQAMADRAGAGEVDAAALYRYLGVAATTPLFVRASEALPDAREFGRHIAGTMRFVRPEAHDVLREEGHRAQWYGQADVVVMFGTVFNDQPRLLRSVLAASRTLPHTRFLVLGAGKGGSPEGPVPPNVRLLDYVPLSVLLPGCSAVVTVGGTGTVMATLAAGLPLVVVPVNADQPTNALRCEALGVGISVSPSQADPEVLTAALLKVLGDPVIRANAQAVGAGISALPGPGYAVRLAESVARTRRPVRALSLRGTEPQESQMIDQVPGGPSANRSG
jgi:MGT family glycosyltransferase